MKSKRTPNLWHVKACPTCSTFMFEFCFDCEGLCEHDKLCRTCKGYGHIVERVPPILVAFGLVLGWQTWTTKKAATEALRYQVDYFGEW